MLEKNFQKKVIAFFKEQKCKVYKVNPEIGFPDLMVLTPKKGVYFVEIKRGNKKPTPLQALYIKELNSKFKYVKSFYINEKNFEEKKKEYQN